VASGAYQVLVNPGQLTTVALPPANQSGIIDFNQVFLSLATDAPLNFVAPAVRLAIGKPGNFVVETVDPVPTGRQIIRGPLTENDEVASVFHQGPASGAPFGRAAPVAILIEYSSP